jgi:predicted DNA-binding protein (MmcQ/YjbR family)
MITAPSFRKLALNLDRVSEQPHFDKASFRINEKIFATLDAVKKTASLKLSPIEQSIYCQLRPSIVIPATGAWGKQGWTVFDLTLITKGLLSEALKKAYLNVAPKNNVKNKSSKTTVRQIQTLHPDKTKTNKKISFDKYSVIKESLLKILQSATLTHTELMECLYQNVKDSFKGGVQWYGETVKLDLEARKIIERTGTKPEKYRIKTKKQ